MNPLEAYRSGFYTLYAQCFPQLASEQCLSAAEQVFNSVRTADTLAAVILTLKQAINGTALDAAAVPEAAAATDEPTTSTNGGNNSRQGERLRERGSKMWTGYDGWDD